jgi:hypothetical protein
MGEPGGGHGAERVRIPDHCAQHLEGVIEVPV